jgi:DHA1 family bicyclomycin/chloramphenicol resistance-like MFS transporter
VFLGVHLHLGPQQYAWLFLPMIVGIMTGSQLSGRAAGKHAPAQTVKRAYGFMAAASLVNLVYALVLPPSLPWAVIPIMFYGVGFAMAMPSVTLITLDLFPTRRGMAASLQGFVSGMVNVVTAGVISPAISQDTRLLAIGMVALMTAGLSSWLMFLRLSRRKGEATEPAPEIVD